MKTNIIKRSSNIIRRYIKFKVRLRKNWLFFMGGWKNWRDVIVRIRIWLGSWRFWRKIWVIGWVRLRRGGRKGKIIFWICWKILFRNANYSKNRIIDLYQFLLLLLLNCLINDMIDYGYEMWFILLNKQKIDLSFKIF